MKNIISKYPDIPEGIKEAINKNHLAVFLGAGVSRLLGCQDWHSLAVELLKTCLNYGYLNNTEYDSLINDSDNKKLITIAYELLKEEKEEIFYDKLECSLKPSSKCKLTNNIYEKILHIGTTFITTNADECFDSIWGKCSPNIIWNFKGNVVLPENHRLYHLHGSVVDRTSLVFTTSGYLNRYRDKDYQRFLRTLFSEYVVLFIGYGLSEFELLDFLMLKSDDSNSNIEQKHFALMSYKADEKELSKYYDLYFKELNIKTIPYLVENNNYEILSDIIDAWQKQIADTTFLISNTVEDLNNIVLNKSLNEKDIDKILNLIQNSDIIFTEFIKLCHRNNWLTNYMIEPLFNKGYFSPAKNKKPEKTKDSLGSYRIPNWEMMEYLKIYIAYVNETNNKEKYELFKNIIFENIRNINKTRIDNFRTDNSLTEFIFIWKKLILQMNVLTFLIMRYIQNGIDWLFQVLYKKKSCQKFLSIRILKK